MISKTETDLKMFITTVLLGIGIATTFAVAISVGTEYVIQVIRKWKLNQAIKTERNPDE